MVIQVDPTIHTPIYVQIHDAVRSLILQGDLRPSERLSSSRELARSIGVNRITVEKAFHRLEADGLVYSRVGSGTFVAPVSGESLQPQSNTKLDAESISRVWSPLFVDPKPAPRALPTITPKPGVKNVSFVYAAPPPDLFPAAEFTRCVNFVMKRRLNEVARLGPADGLHSLKNFLVHWLAQSGIVASEEEVIITTGCQQSLDLIRRALVAPGDLLVLENPTYPGALGALAPFSSSLRELRVEADGPDMRVLDSLRTQNRCKLIYATPNFHNPTGQTFSLETRRHLVRVSRELGVPIIEDDVFGQLRYDGPALPSLRSLCPELAIYVGSFSKILSPGLRVGWVVAPRPLADQLAVLKQASDLHTSLLIQAAVSEFCHRDLLHRHLKRVRRVFRDRRDAMAEALERWFPSDARWKMPEGGLSMWVSLPPDLNTDDMLDIAQDNGVPFLPGSNFYFRSPVHNSLRLSFASENERAIQTGVKKLSQLIRRRRSRVSMMGTQVLSGRSCPIV